MIDGDKSTSATEILTDVAANLIRGIEAVGGRLLITNHGIRFSPHALNLQKIPLDLPFSDIDSVAKRNTMGLIPNGLAVRTKAGVEYRFVVWNRESLIKLIEARTTAS
jgi:hypothetical protein